MKLINFGYRATDELHEILAGFTNGMEMEFSHIVRVDEPLKNLPPFDVKKQIKVVQVL